VETDEFIFDEPTVSKLPVPTLEISAEFADGTGVLNDTLSLAGFVKDIVDADGNYRFDSVLDGEYENEVDTDLVISLTTNGETVTFRFGDLTYDPDTGLVGISIEDFIDSIPQLPAPGATDTGSTNDYDFFA
jgi:hypothetical protein